MFFAQVLVSGCFGKNLIRESVVMSTAESIDSLEWIQKLPIGIAIKDLETQFILQTLKHHNGNRTHAAKTLGISLRTLRNRINELTSRGFAVAPPSPRRQVEVTGNDVTGEGSTSILRF